MSRLHRLQDQLQAHILRGDDAVRDAIVGTARVGADVRLGIYASAYRLRLVEALDTDYPGLHALAGDQSFDQMCRAYIDAHPSAFRSLRWFGHRFAEFLRATEPFSRQPAFAEMAAFEWAMSDVFDAADVELATVADMAAVPAHGWPALRFGLQGSVRRLDLRWNVATIWKSIDAGIEPPPLVEQSHPVGWLVWRQELRTQFRSLEVDEAWALDALRRGATFAELCEGLTEWIDAAQVAVHAAGRLKRWLEDGLIRRLEI